MKNIIDNDGVLDHYLIMEEKTPMEAVLQLNLVVACQCVYQR